MSPTERIAQTFPDINSQGLNTSGTAAGVRSFPQPFVGLSTGTEVLIQRGSLLLAGPPINDLSKTFILPTPVDVTKSWIVDRGQNGTGNGSVETRWRVHMNFSGIAGGIASSITVTRATPFQGVTQFFTVVSLTGAGGTSVDVNVVNCDFDMGVGGVASVGSCRVAGAGAPAGAPVSELSTAQLAKSFCYLRGIDYTANQGATAPSENAGDQPETWHGTLELVSVPTITTLVIYRRFYPGGITATDCGQGDLQVYITAVMFV
jgi:hypothetical protein